MNAVVHAYPGPRRRPDRRQSGGRPDGEVELSVRDWGVGFRPRPGTNDGSLHLGLPLIASVVDSFCDREPRGGRHRARCARPHDRGRRRGAGGWPSRPQGGGARDRRWRGRKAGHRQGSRDRRDPGGLLARPDVRRRPDGRRDRSRRQADDFAEGRVGIEIEECGPNLCLRVGPFQPGGAKRMLDQMELPGMGVSIAKLAERVEVVEGDQGEYISIEIAPGAAAVSRPESGPRLYS